MINDMTLNPDPNCDLCPRLAQFRADNAAAHPEWHNGPVPAFGDLASRLLIVGLAPGLRGANATGRPFTGDWAGELLYPTLLKFGFAAGNYKGIAEDGVILQDARITNAVRCVPPANRPLGPETKACRSFLEREIAAMENLQCIVTLGTVSHGATLGALGIKKSLAPFGHGAVYDAQDGAVRLISIYHCSQYNTNTRRLSVEMFEAIFKAARDYLEH